MAAKFPIVQMNMCHNLNKLLFQGVKIIILGHIDHFLLTKITFGKQKARRSVLFTSRRTLIVRTIHYEVGGENRYVRLSNM